jgi:hypothetical protein
LEEGQLGYLFNTFCNHHFPNVILEIDRKFVLFFAGVNTVEMIYVKPELVTIIDYLTAPLLKSLFHVATRCGVNIRPEAILSSLAPLANRMINTVASARLVRPVIISKRLGHIFGKASMNVGWARFPETFADSPSGRAFGRTIRDVLQFRPHP